MAGRPDTWMPIYWGDYLRDTMHLTTEGHGAYMLLIGAYWTSGKPLPDSDTFLMAVTRLTSKAWQKLKPVMRAFFNVSGGFWHHKRIDAELAKATASYEARKEAGKQGGKAKAKAWQKASNATATDLANACQNPTQPQPPSPSQEENPQTPSASAPLEGANPAEPLDDKLHRSRGTRIPADWEPSNEAVKRGRREGYDLLEIEWLAERFKLFWGGRGDTKIDWDRTFQNHLGGSIARRDIAERRRGVSPGGARLTGIAAAAAARAQRRRSGLGDGVGPETRNNASGFADGAVVIDGVAEPVPGSDGGRGIGQAVHSDETAEPGLSGAGAGGVRAPAA